MGQEHAQLTQGEEELKEEVEGRKEQRVRGSGTQEEEG